MRRSGSHLILYWMFSHYTDGIIYHFNNYNGLENSAMKGERYRKQMTNYWQDGQPIENYDERTELYGLEPWGGKQVLAYNTEDASLQEMRERLEGLPEPDLEMAGIRSIYNNAASRIQFTKEHSNNQYFKSDYTFMDRWAALASIDTRELIVYEFLCEQPRYRKSMDERWFDGVPHQEWVFDHIPYHGFGSSFGNRQTSALEGINERYKDVKLPKHILDSKEIQKLHTSIYGWCLDRNGNVKD